MGEGDDMMRRIVGYLLTHFVLMVVSYMLAQRCGDAVNPFVGIWFGSASLFFFFIGTAWFIQAIIAGEGKEPRG